MLSQAAVGPKAAGQEHNFFTAWAAGVSSYWGFSLPKAVIWIWKEKKGLISTSFMLYLKATTTERWVWQRTVTSYPLSDPRVWSLLLLPSLWGSCFLQCFTSSLNKRDSRTTLGRAEGDLLSDPHEVPADECPALWALQTDGFTCLAPACTILWELLVKLQVPLIICDNLGEWGSLLFASDKPTFPCEELTEDAWQGVPFRMGSQLKSPKLSCSERCENCPGVHLCVVLSVCFFCWVLLCFWSDLVLQVKRGFSVRLISGGLVRCYCDL